MLANIQSVRRIHHSLDFGSVHVLSLPDVKSKEMPSGPSRRDGPTLGIAMVIAIVLFCSSSPYLPSPCARPGAVIRRRVAHHCAGGREPGDV